MKKLRRKVKMIVEKTNTGFSAYASDDNVPVGTTGKTISALKKNMLEALNLFYEDHGYFVDKDNVIIEIDLQQFFQYYRVLNARHLAEKIGMNPTLLSQYVSGKKKPSHAQSQRIIEGIQDIGKELTALRLISN